MKIPKILTICLVVCCLFTGNALAQFHGISFLKQTDDSALINTPVNVSFRILNNVDECLDTLEIYSLEDVLQTSSGPVSSGEILDLLDWNFTGGAAWNDDVTRDYIIMPFGSSAQSDPYSYYTVQPGDVALGELIDQANLGWTDTCEGGTGCGNCATNPEVASASGSTTVVGEPQVSVTKTACPYSKVGDTVTYDITIENTGDLDLELVSVNDSLLGDITAAAAAAGCDTLPVGGSCSFQVLYEVQPGDDTGPGAILVNVIEVNYTATATGQSVTADDDAVVTLLHPSFTLDIQCVEIVDGSALFEANFCNTGDVGLLVDPDDPDIGDPFPLPVPGDGECVTYFIQLPVVPGVCGAAEASKTISALASIIMPLDTPAECQLGNIIEPDPLEATATCTANVNPSFTAEKICLDTTPLDVADGFAAYQINFENTSTGDVPVELLFEIDDPAADGYFVVVGPFAPGESDSVIVQVPVSVQVGCPALPILNSATVTGICVADGSRLEPQIVNADCPGPCADFTVEKICNTDGGLIDGDLAEYGIVITNTGDVPLDLIIDDPSAEPPLVGVVILLNPGEMYETTVSRTVVCAEPGDYVIDNTVSVIAVAPDGTQIGPKEATAECPYTCGGAEGCTPGFWKNHPDCWCDSYTPTMLASDIFAALQDPNYVALGDDERKPKSDFDQDSLLDALKYRGGSDLAGSVRNMLRHATAALLNGCNTDVYYPVSDLLVIDLVNAALESEDPAIIQELHSILAGFNEDYPCPIDAHCIRHEVEPE